MADKQKTVSPSQKERRQKEIDMNKNIFPIALKGIALAMGVAVTVLNILGTVTVQNSINMMSFGLVAIALAALQKE